ncbi:FAD-dependent monooxygenase [Streptomyces javensis]|uniref:FAD-dependent monooxygenase n=1 Tax=Streptomyces javensis TaxID=114698 RepID=UPI003F4D64B2
MRRTPWASAARVNVRMVDRYRIGRGLVAGDAAHCHSPAGGQGMKRSSDESVGKVLWFCCGCGCGCVSGPPTTRHRVDTPWIAGRV